MAGFEYTEYFTKDAISPTNPVPIVRAQNVKMGRFIENNNEAITVELSEQLLRSALYKDCLLMTFIGAGVGDTCIFHSNKRNHLAPNVAKIEPFNEHINMEYALFFFMSSLGQLGVTNISKSTAQASLSMATIRELVIPIPPIKEQSRITNEVTKWFSLIDCIEENRNNLQETIKKAKSKILDLAIHGKLVPQDPTDEPACELLKRINPKAEITCDNPQYQNLPNGWCYGFVGDYVKTVTDFVASGSFSSLRENVKYYNSTNYAILVRTKDFQSEFKKDLVYTDKHGYEFLSNSNLFGGELIFSNVGSIGKVFVVPKLDKKMTLAPNSIMVRFKNEEHQKWFYYLFLSNVGLDLLKSITSATAVGKFNKTDFKKLIIPLPPLNEQHRIVAKIEELFAQLDNIASSL